MVKFKLDTQHEYEDSIKVDILAEEFVPGNGVQTVVAATFFMTKGQYAWLREQADEWFSLAGEG